jgi:twitching motility two-component system response regulator PilH
MAVVLIVDDSPTARQMAAEQLKLQGYTTIEARDGKEAIAKLESLVPDIVITDIVMPNMNGYEFCRWIKNNESTKNVPTIMCSTKDQDFDKYWGMKQGADAYLIKPYSPAELITTVRRLLGTTVS